MAIIFLEAAVILLLLVGNGVFAMTEIAIVSSRRGFLQSRAREGNRGAAQALALAENPNRFLSTVQIGITLVGIVAGAFGGAGIAARLATFWEPVPWIGEFAEELSFVLVIGTLTFASLVIGELVPKRLAMRQPEAIACLMAGPMSMLSRAAAPVVWLLAKSTDGLLRLFGARDESMSRMSREEFTVLVREGMVAGNFDSNASRMIEGAIQFEDLDVRDIMIPRAKMPWIERDTPHERIWQWIAQSPQEFFPVYHERKDNLLGVVALKDCYARLAAGQPVCFRELMQPPLLAPETQMASVLLDTFRATGNRVAFVVNEFGDIDGMVTLIDLMEAIIGDVPSKEEWRHQPVQPRQGGGFLLDGTLPLVALERHLTGFVFSTDTEESPSTLAGMFLQHFQRIPKEGDIWSHSGWQLEVVDMDGIRVDKVLATPSATPLSPSQPL
jgi:putative hemolysin